MQCNAALGRLTFKQLEKGHYGLALIIRTMRKPFHKLTGRDLHIVAVTKTKERETHYIIFSEHLILIGILFFSML